MLTDEKKGDITRKYSQNSIDVNPIVAVCRSVGSAGGRCDYAWLSCTKSVSDRPRPYTSNVGGSGLSSVGWHGRTRRGKLVTIWKSSGADSCTNTYVYRFYNKPGLFVFIQKAPNIPRTFDIFCQIESHFPLIQITKSEIWYAELVQTCTWISWNS